MTDFHSLLLNRRSIRKYQDKDLSAEDVKLLLEAALLAPTSKNLRSWSFTVVEDKDQLAQLSQCKPQFATPISRCKLAVIVSADVMVSDVWVEDASIAAAYIQLQAEALGLGSCWIQVRNRMLDEETSASDAVKRMFNLPDEQQVLCVISIGYKDEERKPADPEKLHWEKVHIGVWNDENME